MNWKRLLLLLPVWLLAAFLLAFPLRNTVNQLVIQPFLYLFWMLNLIYRAIPQVVLWVALIAFMVVLVGSFVIRNISLDKLRSRRTEPEFGPLEGLAYTLQRKSGGVYFKWQVARSLSEIALDLQELRTHSESRSLRLDESQVAPEVHNYLEAGLNTSFSDYPIASLFQPRPKTPFDIELDPVLEYLESQMEMEK